MRPLAAGDADRAGAFGQGFVGVERAGDERLLQPSRLGLAQRVEPRRRRL